MRWLQLMSDEVERASELETEHREASIAAARQAVGSGPAALQCHRCGDDIPEERRQAQPGCRYCVDCKARMERRR